MKKIYKILLVIFIVVIIFGATLMLIKEENITVISEGIGNDKGINNWQDPLNILLMEKVNEVFPEGYHFPIDNNSRFILTVSDFQKQHHVDLSEFNTESVKCDLEKSQIIVYMQNGEVIKSVDLKCQRNS